jgi:hypothetical protein
MRFGTSDHIFNIHDVQLIIIFISLTKIKDIVENLCYYRVVSKLNELIKINMSFHVVILQRDTKGGTQENVA